MGKHAQTSGVQTMRAVRIDHDDASSDYLEVFATSRPGQKIMLSGAGIGTIQMKGVTTGRGDLYYAKVLVPGIAPTEVTATNQTDGTSWKSPVTDLVDVTAASYDLDSGLLTVNARNSVAGQTLIAVPGGALTNGTLTAPLPTPPLNIVVKSAAGGSDTEPVRLIGADFESVAVTAAASANPTNAIPGQAVLLDSTGSSGDITSYQWTQIAGTPVTLTGATTEAATFTAPATGGRFDVPSDSGRCRWAHHLHQRHHRQRHRRSSTDRERRSESGGHRGQQRDPRRHRIAVRHRLPVDADRRPGSDPQRFGNVDRIVLDA